MTDGATETPLTPDAEAAWAAANGHSVAFFEDSRRLVRLVFWNTVATFLTLGFYRFWARTRLRRHYFHRVIVAGATGEYLGRGLELFVGFIIVFSLLGLTFGGLMMGAFFATSQAVSPDSISLAIYVLIFALAPAALYRARRYRLTRTVWRGIRFGQEGSSLRYMVIWLFWLAMTVITLGFAYPWRNVATEHYRANTTRFGNKFFTFRARGRDLVGAWIPAWIVGLGLLGSLTALFVWWSYYLQLGALTAALNSPPLSGLAADFYAISPAIWATTAFVFAAVFLLTFIVYRTREFRYFLSHTQLGDARFRSEVSAREVLACVIPFLLGAFGYLIISFAMVALMVQIVMALPAQAAAGETLWGVIAVVFLVALGILFVASYGITLLFNVSMRSRLIEAMTRTFVVDGLDALEDIVQDSRNAPKFGEGLADAFHFGNF